MVWTTVITGAVPTLMKIVDDHFTQYQEKFEARKKGKEIAGGGSGAGWGCVKYAPCWRGWGKV